MAKVYAPPAGFDIPDISTAMVDGRFDLTEYNRKVKEVTDRLATAARSRHEGDLVGEIIRFPVADGYAEYMVWSQKPLSLVHLAICDGYQIPAAHARGLRITDVRQLVAAEARMRALLAKGRP